jgi:hypothetical protein
MNKPWDIKNDDSRSLDSIYTFLIFCEDETSEFEYLNWFETNLIKINVVPRQNSMTKNVIKAITHCSNAGIIDEDKNVVDGYEVWCVYDRDRYVANELEASTEFNIAHQVAESHKINLAWSNDSFELWILLHLCDVDLSDDSFKKREKYYIDLTEYFRNHSDPNERLQKILSHGTYSYKKDMKHRKNFNDVVRQEILPYTNIAIERAEYLVDYFKNQGETDLDKWTPCTLMHLLVKRLLEVGQKEIPNIN